MNSPEASPTPAAMMPGPISLRYAVGAGGMSLTVGRGRMFAGTASATEGVTFGSVLSCVAPSWGSANHRWTIVGRCHPPGSATRSGVAMISMHTSPLAIPGVGDAGGLNVYVYEVARRLGERGLKVDVFTRQESTDEPGIVELNEHARVIHVTAGPPEPLAKEDLPAPGLGVRRRAGLRQSTPTRSCTPTTGCPGMVGRELSPAPRIPLVHTMHTMARVKNQRCGADQQSANPTFASRARRASWPTPRSSPPTPATRPRSCSSTTGPPRAAGRGAAGGRPAHLPPV